MLVGRSLTLCTTLISGALAHLAEIASTAFLTAATGIPCVPSGALRSSRLSLPSASLISCSESADTFLSGTPPRAFSLAAFMRSSRSYCSSSVSNFSSALGAGLALGLVAFFSVLGFVTFPTGGIPAYPAPLTTPGVSVASALGGVGMTDSVGTGTPPSVGPTTGSALAWTVSLGAS